MRGEEIKKWQEYIEELYKKGLDDPENHNGMVTHLEPDILECEVKWALGSITRNKVAAAAAAAAAKSLQSCLTLRPHRRQPTRLPRPWDSPGKNTGVGCHFLLQCMKVKSESEVAQLCPTVSDPMDCSLPGSSVHGIFQARVLEWVAIAFSGRDL